MDRILQRDRFVLIATLGVMTAAAWAYMAYEAHAMYSTGTCKCAGMKMSGDGIDTASLATLFPLFLMWAEMMVAMMLPTAAPMILAFGALQRKRQPETSPFGRTMLFAGGYLLVWTGFSVIAAVIHWLLNVAGLLSPMMESTSPLFAGLLLVSAGLFQFARIKGVCLARCRSRDVSLLNDWREGRQGVVWMGWNHGLQCAGCCWVLMALLFVGGVMNLWWIAVISAFVLLEKVAPRIGIVSRFSGVALAIWGVWMMIFV